MSIINININRNSTAEIQVSKVIFASLKCGKRYVRHICHVIARRIALIYA